jgi:nucleoside-diphosphate-sugar epimerase
MRTIVTGGNGRLGSVLVPYLRQQGHQVTAIDQVGPEAEAASEQQIEVDLLDEKATSDAVRNADAVVHLANHPGANRGTPQHVFTENVSMNMNVFQAAADAGIMRVVFASSVQVYQGELTSAREIRRHLPSVPIDAELRPSPRNPYGLSKSVGEQMLAYFCDTYEMIGVSLRLPGLKALSDPARSHNYPWLRSSHVPNMAWLWSLMGISRTEVSRLIGAILSADLRGHRVYLPSTGVPETVKLSRFFRRRFPEVAIDVPDSVLDSEGICDTTRITDETGWAPVAGPARDAQD